MWPGLVRIFGIQVTVFGVVMAGMFWVVSFWLWKKFKGDYEEEKIFMLSILIALAMLLGAYSVFWLEYRTAGTSLYGGILGVAASLWMWCRINKWNFWEWADAFGRMGMAMMAVGGLAFGPAGLVRAGVSLIAWGMVWVVSRNYRHLGWYRSGRLGFTALVSVAGFSVVELIVAFTDLRAVYFGGLTIKQWGAVGVLTTCLVVVYLRGGRKVSEDLNDLWQKLQKTRK